MKSHYGAKIQDWLSLASPNIEQNEGGRMKIYIFFVARGQIGSHFHDLQRCVRVLIFVFLFFIIRSENFIGNRMKLKTKMYK